MNNNLIISLNKQVANLGVFYIKLHNYHWFVKGKLFFQLHQKFEELYNEITGHFDEVAERILMLEGTPVATIKEFLELASIEEATGKESTNEMLQSIINDLELFNKEIKEVISISEDSGDVVTADLMTGIKASFEKHIWMLKYTLE